MSKQYNIYDVYNNQLDSAVQNQNVYDPYSEDALQYYSDKTSGQFESSQDVQKYEPKAEEGDIVIVPQFIVHFTRPNLVPFKKRIISFDFRLQ